MSSVAVADSPISNTATPPFASKPVNQAISSEKAAQKAEKPSQNAAKVRSMAWSSFEGVSTILNGLADMRVESSGSCQHDSAV